jgi:hypothetical protein
MLNKAMVLGSITALVMLSLAPIAAADDVSDLKAQIERLNARLEKMESQKTGQIEKEELAQMMKEILDDAKAAPALPAWMKNLKFFGDFRLRMEHIDANGRRSQWAGGPGTPKDRNRIRTSLRFGFIKTWWDEQMEVGFRLATGDAWNVAGGADPTSTNQTMTGDFDKKRIWIDLMYAKYKPKWAKGLEIAGGKVLNPVKTRTMITWDSDINPEGLYVDYVAPFFGDFKPYAQIGFWMVNENGQRDSNGAGVTPIRDSEMLSYSMGFDWQIMDALQWFFGVTYYKWYNADCSTGGWLGRWGSDGQWAGNGGGVLPYAGYASADFGILELTTKVDWKMDFLPTPLQKWSAWFTYVRNCRDDYSYNKNPSGLGGIGADRHFKSDPNAYGVGIQVGENKKKNDFSFMYSFFYIEANSVVPGMSDADLRVGPLGGNSQGHMFKGIYNIDDFLTVAGTILFAQPIHTNDNDALPLGAVAYPHNQDMSSCFRVDLIWKF